MTMMLVVVVVVFCILLFKSINFVAWFLVSNTLLIFFKSSIVHSQTQNFPIFTRKIRNRHYRVRPTNHTFVRTFKFHGQKEQKKLYNFSASLRNSPIQLHNCLIDYRILYDLFILTASSSVMFLWVYFIKWWANLVWNLERQVMHLLY